VNEADGVSLRWTSRLTGDLRRKTLQLWSKGLVAIAGVAAISALCVSSASAAPITGIVNISGSVDVGGTLIDFQPPAGPPNGAFAVSNSGNTGSFAGLNNTAGSILDIPTMSGPLPGFITFAAAPNIRLDLTSVDPGTFTSTDCGLPAAPGQTCTPGPPFPQPNPFNLSNSTATLSTAAITFHGTAVNTITGETSSFVGVFSSQFTVPYQTLLAEVSRGASISTSYSASITATPTGVPEPATMILLGSGLIGVFVIGRKRAR
jgi:hypothetical protein